MATCARPTEPHRYWLLTVDAPWSDNPIRLRGFESETDLLQAIAMQELAPGQYQILYGARIQTAVHLVTPPVLALASGAVE